MTAPTTPAAESPEEAAQLTTLRKVNRTLSRPEDEQDSEVLDVVEAVCSLVPTFAAPRGEVGPDGTRPWTAYQRLGATYLAARLFRRKDSPGGMVSFVEGGGAMVAGNWPDIAMMLGLGQYAVGRPG